MEGNGIQAFRWQILQRKWNNYARWPKMLMIQKLPFYWCRVHNLIVYWLPRAIEFSVSRMADSVRSKILYVISNSFTFGRKDKKMLKILWSQKCTVIRAQNRETWNFQQNPEFLSKNHWNAFRLACAANSSLRKKNASVHDAVGTHIDLFVMHGVLALIGNCLCTDWLSSSHPLLDAAEERIHDRMHTCKGREIRIRSIGSVGACTSEKPETASTATAVALGLRQCRCTIESFNGCIEILIVHIIKFNKCKTHLDRKLYTWKSYICRFCFFFYSIFGAPVNVRRFVHVPWIVYGAAI